jgi:hypothetical protein
VCARRVFVGSGNASGTSRLRKIEAVVETTDANVVRRLRAFGESLIFAATELTDPMLKELARHEPLRPRPDSTKRPAMPITVPGGLEMLRIMPQEYATASTRQERAALEARPSASAAVRRHGTRARLIDRYDDSWPRVARWRDGDWWMEDTEGYVYSPAFIVSRHRVGNAAMFWSARPSAKVSRRPWNEVAGILRSHDIPTGSKTILGANVIAELLALFA